MGRDHSIASNPVAVQQAEERNMCRSGKYLTFLLAEQEYGIEIFKVIEIVGLQPITPVPNSSPHIRGVINLRGTIIPVVDVRIKFGLPEPTMTDNTCIIIVCTNELQVGIIVDKVYEVLFIDQNDITDIPAFDASVNTDYILGIGKKESKITLLLDIDKVLASQSTNNGGGTLTSVLAFKNELENDLKKQKE